MSLIFLATLKKRNQLVKPVDDQQVSLISRVGTIYQGNLLINVRGAVFISLNNATTIIANTVFISLASLV